MFRHGKWWSQVGSWALLKTLFKTGQAEVYSRINVFCRSQDVVVIDSGGRRLTQVQWSRLHERSCGSTVVTEAKITINFGASSVFAALCPWAIHRRKSAVRLYNLSHYQELQGDAVIPQEMWRCGDVKMPSCRADKRRIQHESSAVFSQSISIGRLQTPFIVSICICEVAYQLHPNT